MHVYFPTKFIKQKKTNVQFSLHDNNKKHLQGFFEQKLRCLSLMIPKEEKIKQLLLQVLPIQKVSLKKDKTNFCNDFLQWELWRQLYYSQFSSSTFLILMCIQWNIHCIFVCCATLSLVQQSNNKKKYVMFHCWCHPLTSCQGSMWHGKLYHINLEMLHYTVCHSSHRWNSLL